MDKSRTVKETLVGIESELVQRQSHSPLNPPSRLNFKLAALLDGVQNADAAPTEGQIGVFEQLEEQVAGHLDALQATRDGELAALNASIRASNVDPISALRLTHRTIHHRSQCVHVGGEHWGK